MQDVRVLVAPFLERTVQGKCFWPFMRIAARAPIDGYSMVETPWQREDIARERAVEALLSNDRYTHILMLDIDHEHPEDIVKRLSRWVGADPARGVVGALCFRRGPEYEPMAFIKGPDGKYIFPYPCRDIGLVEVDRIGLGACLIDRRVFEALPQRGWFTYTYDRLLPEGVWPDTSLVFSDRVKGAGLRIFVDTTTVSPHWTDGWVDDKTLDSYIAKQKWEAKRRRAAARAAKGGKT